MNDFEKGYKDAQAIYNDPNCGIDNSREKCSKEEIEGMVENAWNPSTVGV